MALHDLGREDESASVLQELIDLENDNYAEIMADDPISCRGLSDSPAHTPGRATRMKHSAS